MGGAGKDAKGKGRGKSANKGEKGKGNEEQRSQAPPAPKKRPLLSKEAAIAQITALDPENDDERAALSKKISWILRKGAERINIPMTDAGFAKMSDLLKAEVLDGASEAKLLSVIDESNNQKLRYEVIGEGDAKSLRAIPKTERKAIREGAAPAPATGVPWAQSAGLTASPETRLNANAPTYEPTAAAKAQVSSGATSFTPSGQTPMMPYGYPYGYYGYPYNMMPQAYQQQAMMQQQQQQQQMTASGGGGGGGNMKGRIKSFTEEKGFGFIESADAYALYERDVFLHKSHIGSFKVGDVVSFTVSMNKQGFPQANNLAKLAGGEKALGKGKGKGKDDGKGKGKKAKFGKVGYAGDTPNDKVIGQIKDIVTKLAPDIKVHVGFASDVLKEAGAIQGWDFEKSGAGMFQVIIAGPGGDKTAEQVKKLAAKASVLVMQNSADAGGQPGWMKELDAKGTFDSKDLNVDAFVEKVKELAAKGNSP